jgi:eukaryotic-like serine/threonine-protein kinase
MKKSLQPLGEADAAIREALFGNAVTARASAAAATALAPRSRDAEALAALAYAFASDPVHAQSLEDDLNNRFAQDTVLQLVWLPTIRAQIEAGRKHPAKSIELLEATTPYELGMLSASASDSCLYPVYVRAQAYLNEQQSVAAAEFQKILDHRGLLWNCATGALAHLGLARAYALQGDTAKARTAYLDFLTLWKDRPRHPHPEGSQGGIRQAAVANLNAENSVSGCLVGSSEWQSLESRTYHHPSFE